MPSEDWPCCLSLWDKPQRDTTGPQGRWIHLTQRMFLDVPEGKHVPWSHLWDREKRRHLSSHFQPVPRFPLSNFTPWGVNFRALPECTIQLLPVLMGPHPRPCGWLCHPTPEMAGRARNSKQGTGWPSSSDRQGQGPSFPQADYQEVVWTVKARWIWGSL